jgi:iron complex outermembrane recepter protein
MHPFQLKNDRTNTQPQRAKLLTLAVLGCLASANGSAVSAQTAPASSVEKKPQIEVITVTAQKRPEDVQKTPLAITSVSGEEIAEQGIRNARDLNGLIPNVVINTNAAATEFTIRGITSTNNTEIGNPAVGFHLDGVYLGRPDQAGLAFHDVERIEVLRGPQGTLWGRNATAGAINVITNKPTNKLEGALTLGVGNFNANTIQAMVNVPVNDVFAIRAAYASEKRKGYMNSKNLAVGAQNDTDDANTTAARIHALYKPNKNFSILLTAENLTVGGYGYATTPLPLVADTGRGGRVSVPSIQARTDNNYDNLTAEANWNFGPANLTYLVSKRESTRNEINYSAGNTARTFFNSKPEQTSHELRLASTGNGPLTWVVGAYTFEEDNVVSLVADLISSPALPSPTLRVTQTFVQPMIASKASAFFGQASFAVSDKLKITAGARSTRDELQREGRNTSTVTLANGTPVAATTTSLNSASVTSSKFNWRLGADYSVDKNTLLYGSVATGYKAGGFFDGVRTATFDNTFKPENVTTAELGVKMRALEGTLQTNVALFKSEYKDLQVSYRGIPPSGGVAVITLTQNAAKAGITGAEIETRWLSPIGRIDLSMAFLDAKYDEFDPVNRSPRVNNSGKTLIKSPRVSGNLAYQYSWYLNRGDITARAAVFYSDKYYLTPENVPLTTQPSYTRTDLSLTYTADKEAWYLQAYGKNLENNNIIAGIGGLVAPNAYLAPPRTFGIRVGMKF